jgi:hypothetical protein
MTGCGIRYDGEDYMYSVNDTCLFLGRGAPGWPVPLPWLWEHHGVR